MFHTVALFGLLSGIPRFEASGEVTGNPSHARYILTLANRTLRIDDTSVTARTTGIYRVVDRPVTDSFVVHHFHDFENDRDILFRFTVELDIGNVPTFRDSMERSFFLDFLDNTHRFFHIDMERIYVVVPIGHARNNTVTFAGPYE